MKPTRKEDRQHFDTGYALLRDALDEFQQIYAKDNALAHTVRTLGAIEETLYQLMTARKGA